MWCASVSVRNCQRYIINDRPEKKTPPPPANYKFGGARLKTKGKKPKSFKNRKENEQKKASLENEKPAEWGTPAEDTPATGRQQQGLLTLMFSEESDRCGSRR